MIQYDPHKWTDHFFDLKGSLVKEIAGRILICTVWASAIVYFHTHVFKIDIPATIHTLIGLALGLLLVFRTNSSYDRFWEGRKLWGGIVNETRNLTRASEAFLEKNPEARKKVAIWMIAFVYASMNVLRGKRSLGHIEKLISPEELKQAQESSHMALYSAKQISLQLQKAKSAGDIHEYTQVALDQNVQLLVDYLGACERIHKTPLPFAYVVHLRRALFFYCFTLPFALVGTSEWIAVPIIGTMFLSYVFFGIEEIGVEIEDPFGEDENDLPLEDICASIYKNTKSILTGSELP